MMSILRQVRGFASLVKKADPAIAAQLSMFPEFKESQDLIAASHFARAIPPLTRMLQVCESFSPPMATETAWMLGNVNASLGKTKEAISLFERDEIHGKEQSIRVALLAGNVALARSIYSNKGYIQAENEKLYNSLLNWLEGKSVDADITSNEEFIKAHEALLLLAFGGNIDSTTRKLTIESSTTEKILETWTSIAENTSDDSLRAHLHSNIGELHLLQERYEDAMEVLAFALKHQETKPELELPLARTLALLATGYHRLGKAVSAEGLFTSALDKYENKTLNSIDSASHAKVLMAYGDLLCQWEKREAVGTKNIQAGQAQLGSIIKLVILIIPKTMDWFTFQTNEFNAIIGTKYIESWATITSTPSNPNHYMGNCIYIDPSVLPPSDDELDKYEKLSCRIVYQLINARAPNAYTSKWVERLVSRGLTIDTTRAWLLQFDLKRLPFQLPPQPHPSVILTDVDTTLVVDDNASPYNADAWMRELRRRQLAIGDGYGCFMASIDAASNRPVGIVSLHVAHDNVAIVNWCGVHPEYRRQGHATNALLHALEYARDVCACTYVMLSAVEEGPIALYKSVGFDVVDEGDEIQVLGPEPEQL
ncbi:hypothetical protein THRCLA_02194 [Thraustotheca clavata]|uniref:N-acetyltransferase domain-containing protein n=1 Tax=Thraustotheca clavata TaxID=74557 RepID=A0A1W0A603_9STRA|nr:hypothetical protein THRCLA_02194 [Thraustotheca clavata]